MTQTLAVTTASTAGLVTVQGNLNTARGALGANSAALAAAADYLTDLTAMYEIGFNTVNDVNLLETAVWQRIKFCSKHQPPCWRRQIHPSRVYCS